MEKVQEIAAGWPPAAIFCRVEETVNPVSDGALSTHLGERLSPP